MPVALARPAAPAATPPPVRARREALVRDLTGGDGLPALPATTVRALALVNDPDASAAAAADLIRRDGVLAAAVLRRANSALWGGRGDVPDLRRAVVRVGLAECGRLVCAVGLRAVYTNLPAAARGRVEALHKHALFAAGVACGLAKAAGGDGGAEFAAGLLHDIGRVVVAARCPDEADEADPLDFEEGDDVLRRERAVLGIDHAAIGYQFAQANDLPEGIGRAVLNHHRPADEQYQRELVAVVAVADRVANHAQRTRNLAGYDPADCPAYELLAGELAGPREEAVRAALPRVVVKALKDARAMLKAGG